MSKVKCDICEMYYETSELDKDEVSGAVICDVCHINRIGE